MGRKFRLEMSNKFIFRDKRNRIGLIKDVINMELSGRDK